MLMFTMFQFLTLYLCLDIIIFTNEVCKERERQVASSIEVKWILGPYFYSDATFFLPIFFHACL
jgi:hypothetical protein